LIRRGENRELKKPSPLIDLYGALKGIG